MLSDWKVASIAATSSPAVKKIMDCIDFSEARVIVEYGAGAGPITEELLKHMRKDAKLIAFETNGGLIEALKEIEDERLLIFHGSAEDVDEHVKECDYIVSGIPFSFLDEEVRKKIIKKSHAIVKKGFVAYQTTTRLKKDLGLFKEVKDELVALNLPPLFIINAIK